MIKYKAEVTHDEGVTIFRGIASDDAAAIKQICDHELCPERAVRIVKTTVFNPDHSLFMGAIQPQQFMQTPDSNEDLENGMYLCLLQTSETEMIYDQVELFTGKWMLEYDSEDFDIQVLGYVKLPDVRETFITL